MYLPPNNNKCLLAAQLSSHRQQEKLRKACSFDFIPFVYDTTDPGVQQLKCHSKIPQFGACPTSSRTSSTSVVDGTKSGQRCRKRQCPDSSKKTSRTPNQRHKTCGWSCDYALIISGGWSKYTNRVRHLHNVQDVYKHLKEKRSFDEKNIKIFFANNSTLDRK